MRAVVQRVTRASVRVDGAVRGEIEAGLLVLLGVAEGDTEAEAEWLAGKVARLRIFADAYGLPAAQRVRLPAAVRAAHAWAYEVVQAAVADDHDAFSRFWRDGGRGRAERTAAWLDGHERQLRDALV